MGQNQRVVKSAPEVDVATVCRSCGRQTLWPVLSLGSTPLANHLLVPGSVDGYPLSNDVKIEARYPLDLVFCPGCTLVQITASVPPEVLFAEYPYFSSSSQTMARHAEALVVRTTKQQNLGADSLVVEIASNDGYLLRYYLAHGVPVLGIEPAQNIAKVARENGVPTVADFFDLNLATQLVGSSGHADVIHAHNVLAHVPDVNGVIAGIAHLLKNDGIAIFETPYVRDMIDHGEFDTIYHEHLFYYSLTSLTALLERHGLAVVDVERIAIHGGSLRVTAALKTGSPTPRAVQLLYDEERLWGVGDVNYYRSLAVHVATLKASLVGSLGVLGEIKARGQRIVGYGASAKGSTLLNVLGIGRETLDYVVDHTPAKIGKYTPGTHLRICDPSILLVDQPDYALLLTWNFAEEILAKESEYRARGGKFIIPIPELHIV